MGLISLSLRDFRCFDHVELALSPGLNLVWGPNASGKTSILEGIFLLGRGRSFRSGHLESVVRLGKKGFQAVGQLTGPSGATTIGLERREGSLIVRVGGRPASGIAQLAETLPVQLLDSQSHLLIEGSPRHRRQFLDWGVFHVEPAFYPVWRRYHRAMQQRNASLRRGTSTQQIGSWDTELAQSGGVIDDFRRRYLDVFTKTARLWAGQALGDLEVEFEYRAGWPAGQSLAEALAASRDRDREQGTTQTGPHRADILIKVDGRAARDRISRGQEKTLAGTLLLAQAAVYGQESGRSCVLLLDDLPSELDPAHLARFTSQVVATGAQTVITAISPDHLPTDIQPRMFHVEQGKVVQMV